MPSPLPDAAARLAALEREAAHQAEVSAGDGRSWVGAKDGIRPVVIVGAGQAGLVLARGLRRRGIDDVVVVDAAPADAAGPWTTYARMHTLRTPKDIAWPTWGTPAVSPRAWFEAVYGVEAWQDIEYFPTAAWQGFLRWYRDASAVTPVASTRVRSLTVTGADDPLELHLEGPEGAWMLPARHVVLATGIEGAGGRHVPALLEGLPPGRCTTRTTTSTSPLSRAGASASWARAPGRSTTPPRPSSTGPRASTCTCGGPRCPR